MDIATLGIRVDASDLKDGEAALKSLGRTGATTERQIDRSTDRMAQGLNRTGNAARSMDGAARGSGQGLRNLGLQLNQVSQQTAATGNFMQALSIQMPDILLGFGTIGILAGIAAPSIMTMGQALLSAGNDSEDFARQLSEVSDAVSNYRALADAAGQSTADMVAEFGGFAGQAGELNSFLAGFARVEAVRALNEAVEELTGTFGGLGSQLVSTRQGTMAEADQTFLNLIEDLKLTEEQALAVIQSMHWLNEAGTMGETVAAAEAMSREFERVFDTVEGIPLPLAEAAQQAARLALEAARVEATQAAQQRSAEELLHDLREQASMSRLIATHGEDSAEVAQARAYAEREAFVETVNSRDVSEELKAELIAAYDHAQLMATTDMQTGIGAAAGEAGRLATNLGIALDTAILLARANQMSARFEQGAYNVPAGRGSDPRDFMAGGSRANELQNEIRLREMEAAAQAARSGGRSGGGGSSGGGGGGGISDEAREAEQRRNEQMRDAERWIERTRTATEQYNLELEELNELQQLGYLDGEAYARSVDLITQELQEAEFGEFLQGIEDISASFADAIVNGEDLGETFRNMVNQMAADLIQSGLQGLITGALGQLGGGVGATGGGFLGGLFGGFRANGGDVQSGKAYVVGERGPELFAPGRSGTIIPNGAMASGGGDTNLTFNLQGANGSTEIREAVMAGLAQYDQTTLPGRINQVNADPRRIG